ncbi:hypothetical protein CHH26_11340 [Qipengyuania flava]|uniref:hypothetical protein n=1 Tax=Qipengyuania flava TaxID=192812 RepID=UPI000B8BE379|nr:hypothetical protein [Qipengyuania flava]ASP30753.1 hypothetical protein CHH26_11340 [Qipengyuania flava]
MDDLREVIALAIATQFGENDTPEDAADAALAAIKQAGLLVVRESEMQELQNRLAVMSRDFHYYGFGRGQRNAMTAQALTSAMIEASNAPT